MNLDLTIWTQSKETSMKNWRKRTTCSAKKLTTPEMSLKRSMLDFLKLKLDWDKILLSRELNI